VDFGDYGLQSLDAGWLKAQTIEAGRIAAQQYIRGQGKLFIRVFPHRSITSTPLETRMGKGKGEPEFWVATIKPGTVLFELSGVTEQQAKMCFARLAHKLPFKVRMIKRQAIA
jgi:large subunit ribosomal protein L16